MYKKVITWLVCDQISYILTEERTKNGERLDRTQLLFFSEAADSEIICEIRVLSIKNMTIFFTKLFQEGEQTVTYLQT